MNDQIRKNKSTCDQIESSETQTIVGIKFGEVKFQPNKKKTWYDLTLIITKKRSYIFLSKWENGSNSRIVNVLKRLLSKKPRAKYPRANI